MRFKAGKIIYAVFPDSDGRAGKNRPVLILRAFEDRDQYQCCAISSSMYDPNDADCVTLAWDSLGRCRTGLNRPSHAVPKWNSVITESQAGESIGYVSGDEMSAVLKLLEQIEPTDNFQKPTSDQPDE